MGRLAEPERIAVAESNIDHVRKINQQEGTSLEALPNVGVQVLESKFQDYQIKSKQIRDMEEVQLPNLRAERDALFGDANTDSGIRFRLMRYKSMARARLGRLHPLNKTIPNIGTLRIERYVELVEDFIEHWKKINLTLSTPLQLGNYTLTDLQADHQKLATCMATIRRLEMADLPLARAEREKIYGDVPESERDLESFISYLLLFRETIQNLWPNHPYSQALPALFPITAKEPPLTFAYNWVETAQGEIQTWIVFPKLKASQGTSLYLQEGIVERTVSLADISPGEVLSSTWNNIDIVDEIDLLEIRDADKRTLAVGKRDPQLSKPA